MPWNSSYTPNATPLRSTARYAHLKRVGAGDTLPEALCTALAEDGTTVAHHAKRRAHRTTVRFAGTPPTYAAKDAKFKKLRRRTSVDVLPRQMSRDSQNRGLTPEAG